MGKPFLLGRGSLVAISMGAIGVAFVLPPDWPALAAQILILGGVLLILVLLVQSIAERWPQAAATWGARLSYLRSIRLQIQWPFKRVTSSPMLDDAKRTLAAVQQSIADDEKNELASLRTTLPTVQAEAREHHQIRAYGRTLLKLPQLDVTTHEAVRVQLAQIAPALERMYNEANAMWQRVGADANVTGSASAIHWLHLYVNGAEYFWIRNLGQLFWEVLTAKGDLRPALNAVCLGYFEWRDKIALLGQLSGEPIEKREGYAAWQEADAEFFKELEKKVAIQEVDMIRHQIRAFYAQKGIVIPAAMPAKSLALRVAVSESPKPLAPNSEATLLPKDIS